MFLVYCFLLVVVKLYATIVPTNIPLLISVFASSTTSNQGVSSEWLLMHYDDVAWEFKVLSLRYTRQSWSILYQLAQSKFSHSVSNILRDYVKYLNFGFIFHSICKCARISNHSFTRGSKISCDSFDSTSYFTNWSFAVSRCKKIPVDFKIECLFKPWKAIDNEFCFVYGITEIRFAPTFAWGDHDLH